MSATLLQAHTMCQHVLGLWLASRKLGWSRLGGPNTKMFTCRNPEYGMVSPQSEEAEHVVSGLLMVQVVICQV